MAAKTDKTRFATDPYGIIERGVPGGDAASSFSVGRVGSRVESVVEPGRNFGSGFGGRLTIPIKDESPNIKKKAKGGKVQTSADTARKLATEMGGMKKGGKPKSGLAVMIAIGETKKPVKKAVGGAMSPQDRALLRIRDRQQQSAPAPRERVMNPKARAMVEAAADKGAMGAPRTAIGRPIPMPNVAKVQYKDGGAPVKKAVGGTGKMRKGMCDKPTKLAKGGAGKVRKGMMTPEGKIIDVMNKIRGK